jgi:hypothetical protein
MDFPLVLVIYHITYFGTHKNQELHKNYIIFLPIIWLFISKNNQHVLKKFFFSFFNQENEEGDLKNKVDLLQLTLLRVRCETEAEMRRLAREVDEKNQVLRQLRRQLEEQSDYKELQHQARYSPIIISWKGVERLRIEI